MASATVKLTESSDLTEMGVQRCGLYGIVCEMHCQTPMKLQVVLWIEVSC